LHAAYNYVLSVVEHFLGLKSVRIPCREPLGKPPLGLVAATVNLPADGDPGRNLPLDFRVKRLKGGLVIGAVKRAEQRTHHLDVFLRHRLLRQPGGLSGSVLVNEHFATPGHSVAGRPKVKDGLLELDAARLSAPGEAHPHKGAFAEIDHFLRGERNSTHSSSQ